MFFNCVIAYSSNVPIGKGTPITSNGPSVRYPSSKFPQRMVPSKLMAIEGIHILIRAIRTIRRNVFRHSVAAIRDLSVVRAVDVCDMFREHMRPFILPLWGSGPIRVRFRTRAITLTSFRRPLFIRGPPRRYNIRLANVLPMHLSANHMDHNVLFSIHFFRPVFHQMGIRRLFHHSKGFRIIRPSLMNLIFRRIIRLRPLGSRRNGFSHQIERHG